MSNVIAFPQPKSRESMPMEIEGATLFMHIRKTTLIVHLANAPQHPQIAGTNSGNI